MKYKIILIICLIVLMLISCLALYKKYPHYNMKIDGVKLAVTLDGDSINSFPKNDDYFVDINCTNVVGEYLYDEDEGTFKLSFKNIESGAKCRLSFTSNPDTLIDVVENNTQYEDNIPSNYTYLEKNEYTGSAPINQFYYTSFSSSRTSGDNDPDALLTYDENSKNWVTSNLTASRYYYYFFNVAESGTYSFCYKELTGNLNHLNVYKGTTNMVDMTSIRVVSQDEICFGVGDLTTSDVIKVVQYTNTSAANVSSISFGFKKANGTTNAGYRYEGGNPNNYVWFNNEMWRIIGSVPTKIDNGEITTTTNLIKIIRNEPTGSYIKDSQDSGYLGWFTTVLFPLLNDYYYGAQNANNYSYWGRYKCDFRYIGIVPSSYYGLMVKEVYWNAGVSQTKITPAVSYSDETSDQDSKGYVGLMSSSDYGFASSYGRPSRTILSSYSNNNYASNNWLFTQGAEYVITSYYERTSSTIIVASSGYLYNASSVGTYSVRPVVYLDPSVYVVSGDGTQATPYKIARPTGS